MKNQKLITILYLKLSMSLVINHQKKEKEEKLDNKSVMIKKKS